MFADIVNVLLFQGETRVQADSLEAAPQRSQYKADDSKLHEQERDVSKFWKNGNVRMALVGLENQTGWDRDMPLRVIGYDGASYRSQLLSGEKRRYPVVTLVLYYGLTPWKGPKTLYECIEVSEELKEYVNDYQVDVFGKTIEFSKAAEGLRKQEKEVYGMQDVMEWLTGENRAEGFAEGQKKGRVSVYYNLRKLGFSQKEALSVTELTEADVKETPQE